MSQHQEPKGQDTKSARLVYQAGLANVFDTSEDKPKRLIQADYRTCESFARGLRAAGVSVTASACNQAGDIADRQWDTPKDDAPWSEQFASDFSWSGLL